MCYDTFSRFERRFAAVEQLVPDAMPPLETAVGRARRDRRARSLVGAAAFVVTALAVMAVGTPLLASRLTSSGPASSATQPSPAASPATVMVVTGRGVEVPEADLKASDRCLLDAGFTMTKVHEAVHGTNKTYGYTWESPRYYEWESDDPDAVRLSQLCRDRFDPPQRDKSAAEIRVVYDRWVLERKCLVDLGYKPEKAPTFEVFLASWTTGPWAPVDGIGTPSVEAMDTCGLEMLR